MSVKATRKKVYDKAFARKITTQNKSSLISPSFIPVLLPVFSLCVPRSSSLPSFFIRGGCGSCPENSPDTTPQTTSQRDIPQPVEGAASGRVCVTSNKGV